MSWVLVGGGGLALGTSAFKYFSGRKQAREAQALRDSAQHPGFQPNQALIDNRDMLRDRYGNYNIPGLSQMRQDINQSASNAFTQGVQGATSGADVLDLAVRTQAMQQQGLSNLGTQNAMGRDRALMDYLGANQAVGQDQVRINQMELGQYGEQTREAAALQQAGVTNQYSAFNDLGSAITTGLTSDAFKEWLDRRRAGNESPQSGKGTPFSTY